jgi:hypothetical protein
MESADREVGTSAREETNPSEENIEMAISFDRDAEIEFDNLNTEDSQRDKIERSVEKLREFEQRNLDQDNITRQVERIQQLQKKNLNSSPDGVQGAGIVFLVIAGILLAAAIIMYIGFLTTPKDVSTAGGCLSAVIGLTGLIVVAILFGVLALLFLIIGLAIYTSASASKSTAK